jgi:hypothetical protein
MNKQVIGESKRDVDQESLGDLVSRLGSSWAALIRDEVDLAKQELREKWRRPGCFTVLSAAIACSTRHWLSIDLRIVLLLPVFDTGTGSKSRS